MNWAWFFDIDGTLVEIAHTPESIIVHDEMPPLLGRLHFLTAGAVALITGRAIADVDRLLSLRGITIAGQHGLEIRLASGETYAHATEEESLTKVRSALIDAVARHPGLVVEYKGLTVALHYRDVPRLAGYAHRLMRGLRDQHVPDFVLQRGKRVVELKPAGRDKGVAIAELMQTEPFIGRTPVFVGDDITDENGFRAVNAAGGHSIKIGRGRTSARWRIRDVTTLREWLRAGMDAATESSVMANT